MEVLSNLKAACTRQAIIFENKDRYALGANMVRAVFGYRAVHFDASINTSIFISEGKKKKVNFTLEQAMKTQCF